MPKFDQFLSTAGGANIVLPNMEWGAYNLYATSSTYDLSGIAPLLPFSIAPGANQNIQLIMAPKDPSAVLVTVKDAASGLPITGATVILSRNSFSDTKKTGRGYVRQTDWSGGDDQEAYVDKSRYARDDGNVDITPAGVVKLKKTSGKYATDGVLESSTFDTGAPANFYQFSFLPTSQPSSTGDESVRFQIATGNSTSSWNYRGPDGTSDTYYDAAHMDVSPVNDGHRYLRYKLYLKTENDHATPSVSDVEFSFTSACIPPGQAFFTNLDNHTFNLKVSAQNYQDYDGTVTVNGSNPWQEIQVSLTP
jgi:hypothetical protein